VRPQRREERGAALVEYALTFVVFMTLIFGIGGFGHALYVYHFVNNAAKEATRWAAVNGYTCNADSSCNGTGNMNNGPANAADVTNFVKTITPQSIDSTKVTVTACGVSGGTACAASTPDICTKGPAVTGVAGSPIPNYPTCTVQVQVQYTFSYILPLIQTTPLTVSSTSEMVIAH
jgi:Flp pilus assembly protein TadG